MSNSSRTAGRCRKSPGGWASRHREKLHVEGLALLRVLLRSDEVGPERQCEKNRVELCKVIPKGSSFAKLTPAKLSVVCSHVNSTGARSSAARRRCSWPPRSCRPSFWMA